MKNPYSLDPNAKGVKLWAVLTINGKESGPRRLVTCDYRGEVLTLVSPRVARFPVLRTEEGEGVVTLFASRDDTTYAMKIRFKQGTRKWVTGEFAEWAAPINLKESGNA